MSFKEIKPEELKENPFTMIGKDWLLITAGTKEHCNTMTASWGGLGVMWGKAFCDGVHPPEPLYKRVCGSGGIFHDFCYGRVL